jgi:hypothetical protein
VTELTLYDAVDAAKIPKVADAVAGYVDGRFRSLPALRRLHPIALWLSICVETTSQAMILDVEAGDATPRAGAAWIEQQRGRGVDRPVIYCSLSTVPELEHETESLQIQRRHWRLWVAHWTGRAHICTNACGVPMLEGPGATQYRNEPKLGYDVTLTSSQWIHAVRHDYLLRGAP